MSEFKYKCIEVPEIINIGNSSKSKHQDAITSYENIINSIAKDGWEFVNIDTISSIQNPGCLAQILSPIFGGAKSEVATFKILIFKKSTNYNLQNAIISKSSDKLLQNYTCPSCKHEIKPDDLFCENCGNKLK